MNDELLAIGREMVEFEPPPPGVRHFLPTVDQEAMHILPRGWYYYPPGNLHESWKNARGREWQLSWLFDGFDRMNVPRYLSCWTDEGNICLAPDLVGPAISLFDPQLPVRPGDVGLLMVRMPISALDTPPMVKSIQERNGRLWACSNEGDFPLFERLARWGVSMQIGGRLVARFTSR
jgi:hypothetical protein